MSLSRRTEIKRRAVAYLQHFMRKSKPVLSRRSPAVSLILDDEYVLRDPSISVIEEPVGGKYTELLSEFGLELPEPESGRTPILSAYIDPVDAPGFIGTSGMRIRTTLRINESVTTFYGMIRENPTEGRLLFVGKIPESQVDAAKEFASHPHDYRFADSGAGRR